mgnify:CR=1 FL=1
MELKRVVVTGLGALTPIGNTVEEYWKGLENGVSGAAPITYFDASDFKTRFACELKDFVVNDHLDRKEARKMDRFTQYAMVVSEEAIKDSGLDLEKEDRSRIGVIWGAGIGGLETFQNEMLNHAAGDGSPRFNPFFIPKMIADIAPGQISIKYGLRGPNFTTVSACASSANSIIDSLNYIRLGQADVLVTGGSEAAVAIAGIGGFNAMHALSTRNDDPATASRPFDKERDGFVLGDDMETPLVLWGVNYDHDSTPAGRLIEDYWLEDWQRVEQDIREISALGFNTVRIHLQTARFVNEDGSANQENLEQLLRLVRLAQEQGLYLLLTGLGFYHAQDTPQWILAMEEQQRWELHARFWEIIADACREQPAVFAYDLMNEPVVPGRGNTRDRR